jgi:Zn-dependent protease
MRWSWKIAQIGDTEIRIHVTFVLIIGWIAMAHWAQERSLPAAAAGVAFILAIFGCVVLHELGHAMAARRYGIRTRDITLYPIGGVARLERMPEKPLEELAVAIAGPAVNVLIALSLCVVLATTAAYQPLPEMGIAQGSFIQRLLIVNLFLAGFNLLPAFPMDGGRVLRALLATRMDYAAATHAAATAGQAMALVFGFVGLFSNPFLLFIAFFVWIGAAQESAMVQMRRALGGIPVAQAMVTQFRSLSTTDTLKRAIDLILSGEQQDFPVLEGGNLVGVLTRGDMLKALAERGQDAPVPEVMQRHFQLAGPLEMLDAAFERLRECSCRTLPVVHRDQLVGLVTMDNVGEFLMIQSALKGSRIRPAS